MGAFDNYQSPKKGGAFDNYQSPSPPATSDDSTIGGRLAHLWQNTKDEARVAANTFDVGNKMIAQGRATLPMMYPGLFGLDKSAVAPGGAYDPATQEQRVAKYLPEERAATAASSERIGPVQSGLANVAGYLPLAAATGGAGLGPIATGAIGGGLAGAGHSTASDPGGIATDAATAAAINAATAGVITKVAPYAPGLARNYVPRAVGAYLGSHFGPAGAWVGNEMAREFMPPRPLAPTASGSWFWPGANTAVQGPLSGQGW